MDDTTIDLRAFVGATERRLLIRGLQALRRERTAAWKVASEIADDEGRRSPGESEFGLQEVDALLRRGGVGAG